MSDRLLTVAGSTVEAFIWKGTLWHWKIWRIGADSACGWMPYHAFGWAFSEEAAERKTTRWASHYINGDGGAGRVRRSHVVARREVQNALQELTGNLDGVWRMPDA